MRTFEWDPALETGNRYIDEDHRHFFEMAERFSSTWRSGSNRGLADELLEALRAHAEDHFAREEQEMTVAGFPETELHVRHHDQMLFMLQTFLAMRKTNRSKAEEDRLAEDALRFLQDWIQLHIEHFDRRFVRFLRNPGAFAAAAVEIEQP